MFTLNRNTNFVSELASKPVQNAIAMLKRDRDRIFVETEKPGGSVVLVQKSMSRALFKENAEEESESSKEGLLSGERYTISVCADKIVIYAQGELGFVYGLIYLSEQYMGVRPFWFWMDQEPEPKKKVFVPEGVICSKDPAVMFRGWRFAEDVLFQRWDYHGDGVAGWQMALEALLRCGGNMAVFEEYQKEELSEGLGEYGVRLLSVTAQKALAEEFHTTVFDYNLQETNQVTMLPDSVEYVNQKFDKALKQGMEVWVAQCSNIRPHIYFLDVIRKIWSGEEVTDISQAEAFVGEYFAECEIKEEVEALYYEYPGVMMHWDADSGGLQEGKRIGEQFYTENVRLFCHQLLVDRTRPVKELLLLPDAADLTAQIHTFGEICRQKKEELEKLCLACTVTENGLQNKALLSSTIGLHIKLHQTCRRAARCFARGYESLMEGDYEKAFLRFGDSAVWFEKGANLLRGAEQGVWKGFYANDCITDIKHTVYMVRKVTCLVRELGDDARHEAWYQKYCLTAEEREQNQGQLRDNHATDQELYEAMKKQVVR